MLSTYVRVVLSVLLVSFCMSFDPAFAGRSRPIHATQVQTATERAKSYLDDVDRLTEKSFEVLETLRAFQDQASWDERPSESQRKELNLDLEKVGAHLKVQLQEAHHVTEALKESRDHFATALLKLDQQHEKLVNGLEEVEPWDVLVRKMFWLDLRPKMPHEALDVTLPYLEGFVAFSHFPDFPGGKLEEKALFEFEAGGKVRKREIRRSDGVHLTMPSGGKVAGLVQGVTFNGNLVIKRVSPGFFDQTKIVDLKQVTEFETTIAFEDLRRWGAKGPTHSKHQIFSVSLHPTFATLTQNLEQTLRRRSLGKASIVRTVESGICFL